MERAGLALRLRWLWFSKTHERRAWHGLDLQFSADEQALFFASTTMVVGDGHSAKFCEDRWIGGRSVGEITPLLACIPKRRRKLRTVAEGAHAHAWARDIHGTISLDEIGQYLMLWLELESFNLSDQPDAITWKWSADGTYSESSCYSATFHGSTACSA